MAVLDSWSINSIIQIFSSNTNSIHVHSDVQSLWTGGKIEEEEDFDHSYKICSKSLTF